MARRPATKVRRSERPTAFPPLRTPSPHSLRLADNLSNRLDGKTARVRLDFIRRETSSTPPPPLALVLRGGRGGEVRLKLMLSLLWVAGGGKDDRHQTSAYPARAWAALLDLKDPETNGQRRILDAINWLEDQKLVKTLRKPGHPMALQLLAEDGSGKPYLDPAPAAKQKKAAAKEKLTGHDYFIALPPEFWTDGWISSLSGRAIALLLVIAEVTFSQKQEFEWVSPERARWRYAISEDTWSKGIAELKERKIIEIRKKPVGEDEFDFRRVRNSYKLARGANQQTIALPAREGLPR